MKSVIIARIFRLSCPVVLLCFIGCSGESASVGDQLRADVSLDAEGMADMLLSRDVGLSDTDQGLVLMDATPLRDFGVPDSQSMDAMGMIDQSITPDQDVVDMMTQQPDQMMEPLMDMWAPRQTPAAPIVQDTGPNLELLIVGNNYVGLHDLCGKIRSLAEAINRWESVTCEMVSVGGYRLIDHADSAASGGDLDALLNAQDPTRTQFDLLILQERAQVSGFPANQRYRDDFEQASEEFAIRASALGMRTALLMPWARPNGDPSNQGLYPDFPTMQSRIAQAHYDVAEEVSDSMNEVAVIEAGEVWFRTYIRNTDNDFNALYLRTIIIRQMAPGCCPP